MTNTTNATSPYEALDAWIDAHFDEEVRFLQELVRVPTDTPPGNNAPHAERAAELLKAFGFDAEKHSVPAPTVQAAGLEILGVKDVSPQAHNGVRPRKRRRV